MISIPVSPAGTQSPRLPAGVWRPFVSRWLQRTSARLPLVSGTHVRPVPGDWEGLDLSGIRPFQPGDSARRLVARATARAQRPMVRVDLPAWRLPLMVVLDRSGPMFNACPHGSPARLAVALANAVIGAAGSQNDPVGVALVGNRLEGFLGPRGGNGQAARGVATRPTPANAGQGVLAKLLAKLPVRLRTPAAWVVFTDGLHPELPEALARFSARHPLWLVLLESPLPDGEFRKLPWVDAATGTSGPPLDAKSWERLELVRAERRQACADAVSKNGQPVSRLNLKEPQDRLLGGGLWIYANPERKGDR